MRSSSTSRRASPPGASSRPLGTSVSPRRPAGWARREPRSCWATSRPSPSLRRGPRVCAAIALGNFSWDWIYAHLAAAAARRFAEAAEWARAAYRSAALLLRLPFAGELSAFPQIEDIPLVARRPRLEKAEARRRLGLDERPAVLLSFGGIGFPGLSLAAFGALGGLPAAARRSGAPAAAEAPPSDVRVLDTAALDAAGVALPGSRRRRRRRRHEAGLRHRQRLHRSTHPSRVHRARRLPGVPDHGLRDAEVPAGRARLERRAARGPDRGGGGARPWRRPFRRRRAWTGRPWRRRGSSPGRSAQSPISSRPVIAYFLMSASYLRKSSTFAFGTSSACAAWPSSHDSRSFRRSSSESPWRPADSAARCGLAHRLGGQLAGLRPATRRPRPSCRPPSGCRGIPARSSRRRRAPGPGPGARR